MFYYIIGTSFSFYSKENSHDKQRKGVRSRPAKHLHPGPPATPGAPASRMLKLLQECIGGGTIQNA